MKLWIVAYWTLLRNLRDIKLMVVLTIFPILLILIVGSALDKEITPQNHRPETIGVYYPEGGSETGARIGEILSSDLFQGMTVVDRALSLEDGQERVRSGEWNALLVIPEGPPHASGGASDGWKIYTSKGGSLLAPALESLAAGAGPEDQTFFPHIEVPVSRDVIGGIDYYSVATLLQFILMGSVLGIFAITRELKDGTYRRQLMAPVSSMTLLWGKALGALLALSAATGIVVLGAKVLLQAHWRGNPLFIMAVLLLFCFISVLLGMILAIWTRSAMLSTVVMFPVMIVFTLTAGGFGKQVGPALEALGRFSPNTYGTRALIGHMYGAGGGSPGGSLLALLWFAGAAAVLFILSSRRGIV